MSRYTAGAGLVLSYIHNVMGGIVHNWASVSEPHTCDFNATFSLYDIYIYICDRHCTSNIAINTSIFHLGLIRGARAYCPDAYIRGAVGPTYF